MSMNEYRKIGVLLSSPWEYFRESGDEWVKWQAISTIFRSYVHFPYSLKTPDNHRFSDVFRGIETEHWPEICL